MKFLKNTIGFIALFAALPAFAVTARPSVTGVAASRLPTVAAQRSSGVTYTYQTASSLLDNSECISAYTSCIQDSTLCGEKFENCTTSVEFQGKMAQCLSTLSMCDASGINALFGTSSTSALGTVKSYKTGTKNKEVSEYTYPTSGSVLGQMITSGYIASRLDTQSCIKKYTNCLHKTEVCGADFELCTNKPDFKKKRLLCDNVLSKCQSDGVKALFGGESYLDAPLNDSRIGEMISDGAAYAALNAVNTCYTNINDCIRTACQANPYKCKVGVSIDLTSAAEGIVNLSKSDNATTGDVAAALGNLVSSANSASVSTNTTVKNYIASVCRDSISKNASCMATFATDGVFPNNAMLGDEDNQDETWSNAYDDRIAKILTTTIQPWLEDFDNTAKSACVNTISDCAIATCGGGNGVSCYVKVFGTGTDRTFTSSINGASTYDEIKAGCAAVVNTDQNCIYAMMNKGGDIGSFSYSYYKDRVFDELFGTSSNDPIGAVAALNKRLSETYNAASIANARTGCQATATACIREKCGTDYVNCYRNRNDIYSDLTKVNSVGIMVDSKYASEMNKVGGVLDSTIVLGLCLDTVKNAPVCQTHLSAVTANVSDDTTSWGSYTSVRSGWLGAGATQLVSSSSDRRKTDSDGNLLCGIYGNDNINDIDVCDTVRADGKVYNAPRWEYDYEKTQAAQDIFSEVLYDIEKEVQGIYNAKLTKEQNACLAMNSGGLNNTKDGGGVYAWVKLKGKVPSKYETQGLKTTEFTGSNEIYNSFCRVRVSLQSNDKDIQKTLDENAGQDGYNTTAYFAVGDSFTCGSWLSDKLITKLSEDYAVKTTGTNAKGKLKDGQQWAVAGVSLLGGGLGAWGFDALQTKTGLGGLMKTTSSMNRNDQAIVDRCIREVDAELEKWKNFEVENTVCVVATNTCAKYKMTYDTSISGVDYKTLPRMSYTYTDNDTDSIDMDRIAKHISELETKRSEVCGIDKYGNGVTNGGKWGRALVDTLGAGIGAAATGVTTAQIMKAQNKQKFTEAQQEWMDNIGSKIHCVIGSVKAGSFGDLISTEMDIDDSTSSGDNSSSDTNTSMSAISAMFR